MTPSSPPVSSSRGKPRVLLVDDDRISRLIMSKTLGESYNVEHAQDGISALQAVGSSSPHVVISDIEMPRMGGLELTRALKKHRRFANIPVILVTGHTERDAIHQCFEAGADDYLPKPIDARELHARVGAAVRGSQLAEELEETHRKLLNASRQAGQAEVASGVLHNVGNALNGVNISVKLLRDTALYDFASKVIQIRDLLQEHENELQQSMGRRASLLINYCSKLADEYRGHTSTLAGELERLIRLIDHTNTIISSQQNLAKGARVVTTITLPQLVRIIEEVMGNALDHVAFVKELDAEQFEGDESRVLQILANLLSNAVHATRDVEEPRIVLACSLNQEAGEICFTVTDNGVGISAETLARIFEHGFTTKPDGHGFGLHHSINSAREMGGELTVHSDGEGRGARFQLKLPLSPSESATRDAKSSRTPRQEKGAHGSR